MLTHKHEGISLSYSTTDDHEILLAGLTSNDLKKALQVARPKRCAHVRSIGRLRTADGPVLAIRLRPRTADLTFEELTSKVLDRICMALARSHKARVKPAKIKPAENRHRKDQGYVHQRTVAPQALRL
ncbi:MAG TPA: hypothetical protein VHC21_00650 [Candidatus Saccharimonadales bacterium]|nr:hypothetical protein [Candidatus Saccharimonadales bacterium]